jgi:hypothetical protein
VKSILKRNGNRRPEESLLICCARTSLDSEHAGLMKSLLSQKMDWSYLMTTAQLHGMMPLLYWNLKACCPDAVPKVFLDQLSNDFQANARHNLFLTGELLKLLKLFEAQGVRAVPFKGPTLASSVYGNLAFRQFTDLDILVHQEDVLKVSELLIQQGYRPQFHLTREQTEDLLQYQCELSFTRDDNVMIDLHWGFVARFFSFWIDPEILWSRLKGISLGGTTVLSFSPEDLLLILCLHGAKHSWERLDWIRDIAEMIKVYREINWEWIFKEANRLGIERMLFLCLSLAIHVVGTNLPQEVSRRLGNDSIGKSIAYKVSHVLFQERRRLVLFRDLLYLKTMERVGDRIRFCYKILLMPTPLEWEFLPLPRLLHFLYYVIRPVRLMAKYFGILIKNTVNFFKPHRELLDCG